MTRLGFSARSSRPDNGLAVVLVLALAFAGVFVLRYLGLWSEQDTSVFLRVIASVDESGSIRGGDSIYPHGYAFQVWASAFGAVAGGHVNDLATMTLPIVGMLLLAATGYAAFRTVLGRGLASVVAAVALVLVPEIVFSVSRGNHEKLTIALTLVAVMALLSSFLALERGRWRTFSGWVGVLYLNAFTLASLNAFFGSMFILAVTLALVFASLMLGLRRRHAGTLVPIVRRLIVFSAASWAVVVLVLFFVYPPAGNVLRLLSTGAERVAALALSLAPESDPYAVVARDWVSPWAYQIMSSFRWVLFAVSFVWWVRLLVDTIRAPGGTSLRSLYLVALYGAFGLQLALAIAVDHVGLSAGSNLQVRLFTYFMLFAAPLFGLATVALRNAADRHSRTSHFVWPIISVLAVFGIFSIIKATLDPVVSNRWLFYTPTEVAALRFWDDLHEYQSIWTDPEGRMRYAYIATYMTGASSENTFDSFDVDASSTHALESPIIAAGSAAQRRAPPVFWNENRTYDNGEARIYHRIPRTPFQR